MSGVKQTKSQPKTVAWTGTITDDAYSAALSMEDFVSIFAEITMTGTLSGPVHLYGCNTSSGTYSPLLDSAGSVIVMGTFSGSTATVARTVHGIASPWIKFFYDDTSGSGTISATVVKAVGA